MTGERGRGGGERAVEREGVRDKLIKSERERDSEGGREGEKC